MPCFYPNTNNQQDSIQGPTAKNQFLELGVEGFSAVIPTTPQAVIFDQLVAQRGTNITVAQIPTAEIRLAANHTYLISWEVNGDVIQDGGLPGEFATIQSYITEDGITPFGEIIQDTREGGLISINNSSIEATDNTDVILTLQIVAIENNAQARLTSANISVIQLL